ncbi:MAG TPA: hypothetical protein DEB39_09180 [Planctomycetaceae bacterium]|nr:hypothetical protein [Planctomycetaceae bacterium]
MMTKPPSAMRACWKSLFPAMTILFYGFGFAEKVCTENACFAQTPFVFEVKSDFETPNIDLKEATANTDCTTIWFKNTATYHYNDASALKFGKTWRFEWDSRQNHATPILSTNAIEMSGAVLEITGDMTNSFSNARNSFVLLEATIGAGSDPFSGVNAKKEKQTIDWNKPFQVEDFLAYTLGTKSVSGGKTQIVLEQNLSWYQPYEEYTGSFTVDSGKTFTVDAALNNVAPVSGNWDGRSLVKKGQGFLVLNQVNGYVGATEVLEGTLALGVDQAIDKSAVVAVHAGATLNLGGKTHTLSTLLGEGRVAYHSNENLTLAIDHPALKRDLFEGAFASTAGTLTKTGGGTFELYNTAIASSLRTINVNEGLFLLNADMADPNTINVRSRLGGDGSRNSSVFFQEESNHTFFGAAGAFEADRIVYKGGSAVSMNVGKSGISNMLDVGSTVTFSDGGGNTLLTIVNYEERLHAEDGELHYTLGEAGGGFQLNGMDLSGLTPTVGADQKTLTFTNGSATLVIQTDSSLDIVDSRFTPDGFWTLDLKATGDVSMLTPAGQTVYDAIAIDPTDSNDDGVFFKEYLQTLPFEEKQAAINQMIPYIDTTLPIATRRAITRFNDTAFSRIDYLAHRARNGCSNKIYQLWAEADGEVAHLDTLDGVTGYKLRSIGGTVGLDAMVLRDLVLGVDFSGLESKIDLKDDLSDAKIGMFLTSLYGMWYYNNWSVKASAGYGWNEYKTYRTIPLVGERVSGKHQGNALFTAVEVAKRLRYGQTSLTPFYKFEFVELWEDAYSESSDQGYDPGFALNFDKRTTRGYLQTVGARLSRDFVYPSGFLISPSIYGGWIHDFGKSSIGTSASGDQFVPYSIRGVETVVDRAQLGIGVDLRPSENLVIFGRYEAELAEGFDAQLGNIGLGLVW